MNMVACFAYLAYDEYAHRPCSIIYICRKAKLFYSLILCYSMIDFINHLQIPLLAETDILVIGAGSAGCLAALAARQSRKYEVMLVERYGFAGGTSLREHLHAAIGVSPLAYRRTFRGALSATR